jgi:hypothetical protein
MCAHTDRSLPLQGCHMVDVELMAAQWGNPTAYLKTGDHLHQVWRR